MTVEAESQAQTAALLERVALRDESALTGIHALYGRRLYAFALHRLGDSHEAEAVAADTLYEVWKRPEMYRGESKFSTWLLGIARNKVLTVLRQRHRTMDDIDDHAEQLIAPEPTPDIDLENMQQKQIIRHCMEKLDALRRECLHLVFYEGLSLADVAVLQDIPVNTVKTRLFHARQKLKDCLKYRLPLEAT